MLLVRTTSGNDIIYVDTFAIYLNKSNQSRSDENFEEAINYLSLARKFCKNLDDYATLMNYFGGRFFELSDYYTAINYYDSILLIKDEIQDPYLVSYVYNNFGLACIQIMEFEKAINLFRKALLGIETSKTVIVYHNLAKCYEYLKDKDSTLYYLNLAYSIEKKTYGLDNYMTLITGIELADLKGYIPPDLKQSVYKNGNNKLIGLILSMEGNYSKAEPYLSNYPKLLLKLHVRSNQWNKAISMIDTLRIGYLSVDSKLFLQAHERLIYKNAIDEYLANSDTLSAFKTALKSHANVLKENLEYRLDNYPESYNYFDFDSVIYLFVMKHPVRLYKIKADSAFQEAYDQFLSAFNMSEIMDDFMSNYRRYAKSSSYLYSKLVPELSDEMLIIPEGRLLYIPFEALLTKMPDTTQYPVYAEMPYLLNHSVIHYDYILREYESTSGRKSITALAPDESLDYAVKEVRSLWKYNSKRYTGEKALLEKIYDGELLHIAAHYDPLEYSIRLADSVINMSDLNDLHKELVIISTCYSGFGKRYIGEGSFSAGRAFYMAGSESVVESLWSNDDRSSYIIFDFFYKQLAQGKSKGECLTLAKKHHLKTSPTYLSHPYFWANLRLFGNDSSVNIKRNWFWAYGIIFIVLLVFLLRFSQRSRRTD